MQRLMKMKMINIEEMSELEEMKIQELKIKMKTIHGWWISFFIGFWAMFSFSCFCVFLGVFLDVFIRALIA